MEKRRKNRIILSHRYSDTRFRRKKTGSSQYILNVLYNFNTSISTKCGKNPVTAYERTKEYFDITNYQKFRKCDTIILSINR